MRRSIMIPLAAALLIGCDSEPLKIERNQTEHISTSSEQSFTATFENPCEPGTVVTLSGTLRFDSDFHFDAAGGAHGRVHIRTTDATAVAASGMTFEARGGLNDIVYLGPQGLLTTTKASVFNLRSTGPGSGILVQSVTHLTFANGEVRAVVVQENAQCTGK